MKGQGTLIFVIVVIVIVAGAIIYFLLKKPSGSTTGGTGYGKGKTGGNSNTGSGNSNTGSGNTGTGTIPPVPPATKTIKDFEGQWIKAKYNDTRLYDSDLNLLKAYNAGEDIGRLGGEAVGYLCCQNRAGFYKITESVFDNNGFCRCEPLMSDETLKAILGL